MYYVLGRSLQPENLKITGDLILLIITIIQENKKESTVYCK